MKIKRGDTKRRRWRLTQGRKVLPLQGATQVRFLMAPAPGFAGPTASILCDIVDAAGGEVSVLPTAATFGTTGSYDVEFEITWADGTTETVPDGGYEPLEVLADLG